MSDNNKGISCQIYRWNLGECSNGGISSKVNAVVLVGPNIDQVFEADEMRPAVKLVKRIIAGKEYVHAEPILPNGEWKHFMAGGTYIKGDSRFSEAVGHGYPISLHDRTE